MEALALKRLTKDCRSAICAFFLALSASRRSRAWVAAVVVVVVTRVDAQLAVVQIGHVGADHVQEVTVMRDDDHGAVTAVEHLLQPADGVDIRLLVGSSSSRMSGWRRAPAPATRSFQPGATSLIGPFVLFHREYPTQQQFAGAGFGGVAVIFGDQAFQLGGLHVVVVGGLQVGVDGIAFGDAPTARCGPMTTSSTRISS